MYNVPYPFASGNKTILQVKSFKDTMMVQLAFTALVAVNVTVEVWITTDKTLPFRKIDAATETLVAANGTALIILSGLSPCIIQFRLVTPTANTAGSITAINVINGSEPVYLPA